MRKLKLTKALSYSGAVRATAKHPVVTVDDATAETLLASGYFSECGCAPDPEPEKPEPEEPKGPAIEDVDYEALAAMTKAELARVAAENGIDVTGCRTKADMLETISIACGGNYTMIELQRLV